MQHKMGDLKNSIIARKSGGDAESGATGEKTMTTKERMKKDLELWNVSLCPWGCGNKLDKFPDDCAAVECVCKRYYCAGCLLAVGCDFHQKEFNSAVNCSVEALERVSGQGKCYMCQDECHKHVKAGHCKVMGFMRDYTIDTAALKNKVETTRMIKNARMRLDRYDNVADKLTMFQMMVGTLQSWDTQMPLSFQQLMQHHVGSMQ
jgi:hypothetical protein